MNYKHPFTRVLGYWRVNDIVEVDITEFRVYQHIYLSLSNILESLKILCCLEVAIYGLLGIGIGLKDLKLLYNN